MKQIFIAILVLLSFSSHGQSYYLEASTPLIVPNTGGTTANKLVFTVKIRAKSASFLLGTSNIRISYNQLAFNSTSMPSLEANLLPNYVMTVTRSGTTNAYYANLNPTQATAFQTVDMAGVDIAKVALPITDETKLAEIMFRLFLDVSTVSGAYANASYLPATIAGTGTKLNNTAGTKQVADGPLTTIGNALVATPLPIKLSNFAATEKGASNLVVWETTEEINVRSFAVEKSADAKAWTVLGTTTPNPTKRYNMVDNNPSTTTYYRLRNIDKDGREDVSKVVVVNRKKGTFNIANVSPNPTSDNLNVSFETADDSEITMTVVDALGKQVLSNSVLPTNGINNTNLDVSALPSGSYFLNINNGKTVLTTKVVKQ